MRNGDGMVNKSLSEGREYIGISRVAGPLVFVDGIHNVGYNELAEVVDPDGRVRLGMILESAERAAVIQVFEGTSGLSIPETRIRFRGEPLKFGVSGEILGRVFNGLGAPIDAEGGAGRGPRAVRRAGVRGEERQAAMAVSGAV